MNLKTSDPRPKSHRSNITTVASSNRSQASKRRSSRMSLHAPVGLSGEDRKKCSFTMPARATNLNRHGASVQLSRDLSIGSVIVLRNQRGAEISARVVAQLAALQGVSTYGIEFLDQEESARDFWGISFPTNA